MVNVTIKNITNSTFDIWITNTVPIAGFQFQLLDISVNDLDGGVGEEYLDSVNYQNNYSTSDGTGSNILGFSFSGGSIPTNSMQLLTTVNYTIIGGEGDICFGTNEMNNVFSDNLNQSINTTGFGECYVQYGCTNSSACNYNPDAITDDGSCHYADWCHNCYGICICEIDCTGTCGGDAVIQTYYYDDDGDGLGCTTATGGSADPVQFCSATVPPQWVLNNTDAACYCVSNNTDECGVCDGDNSTCCTHANACNYLVTEGDLYHDGVCGWRDCNNDCTCQGGNQGLPYGTSLPGQTCVVPDNCNSYCGSCNCDCLGVCNGLAVIDECGICDGPGANLECGCYPASINCCGGELTCDEWIDGTGDCYAIDIDGDGICDDSDNCNTDPNNPNVDQDPDSPYYGLDGCGECNGPGPIYECGCTEIPDGACDCYGNVVDECGECGGNGANIECSDGSYACDELDCPLIECPEQSASCTEALDYCGTFICDGECWFNGDISHNMDVSVQDIIYVIYHIVGVGGYIIEPGTCEWEAANINTLSSPNSINIYDLVWILNIIMSRNKNPNYLKFLNKIKKEILMGEDLLEIANKIKKKTKINITPQQECRCPSGGRSEDWCNDPNACNYPHWSVNPNSPCGNDFDNCDFACE